MEVKFLKNPANGKTKNPQNLVGKLMVNKQKYFLLVFNGTTYLLQVENCVSGHTMQSAWWRGRQKIVKIGLILIAMPPAHPYTTVQCHDSLHLMLIFQTPIDELVKLKK